MGTSGLNDKSDAFRHAFWQAINVQSAGATITSLFADAHESSTPTQLLLEKQMDEYNNAIGIAYAQSITIFTLNSTISTAIWEKVIDGELKYLSPIQPPKYDFNGQLINANGDPDFYGPNGTNVPSLATHGLINQTTTLFPQLTVLIFTNQ